MWWLTSLSWRAEIDLGKKHEVRHLKLIHTPRDLTLLVGLSGEVSEIIQVHRFYSKTPRESKIVMGKPQIMKQLFNTHIN